MYYADVNVTHNIFYQWLVFTRRTIHSTSIAMLVKWSGLPWWGNVLPFAFACLPNPANARSSNSIYLRVYPTLHWVPDTDGGMTVPWLWYVSHELYQLACRQRAIETSSTNRQLWQLAFYCASKMHIHCTHRHKCTHSTHRHKRTHTHEWTASKHCDW